MAYVPKNHFADNGDKLVIGGKLEVKSSAEISGIKVIEQFSRTAEEAVAADNDAVAAGIILPATAGSIETGFTAPPCARNITAKLSTAIGASKKIKVYGTDNYGNSVEEEITLNNSTSLKSGAKAFRTVTKIDVPARAHTPAYQTETIEVTAACTTAGNITVAVTSALFASSKSVTVTLATTDDSVTKVAEKVVAAINASADIKAEFTASNSAGVITLTAKKYADNDSTLALAFTVGSTGVTVGSSTAGTSGVAEDKLDLGFGDVLGLECLISKGVIHMGTYLDGNSEATAPTFTTSATELASNTIKLSSTLSGKTVESDFVNR